MKTRQLVKTMAALTLPLIVGEIFNDLVTTAADDMVITATELMDAESIGALVVEDDGTVEVKIGIVIRKSLIGVAPIITFQSDASRIFILVWYLRGGTLFRKRNDFLFVAKLYMYSKPTSVSVCPSIRHHVRSVL